jgi:hypothetical protein
MMGLVPEQALRMATSVPARLINQPALAQLAGQPLQNLLLLGPDWMPDITSTRHLGTVAA